MEPCKKCEYFEKTISEFGQGSGVYNGFCHRYPKVYVAMPTARTGWGYGTPEEWMQPVVQETDSCGEFVADHDKAAS